MFDGCTEFELGRIHPNTAIQTILHRDTVNVDSAIE